MRWPNCLRSFAYAVATSRAPWAMPDGLRGDARAAAIERPHRDLEPVALGADAVRLRDANAVEGELGRRAAAQTHLVLEAGDGEARGRDLDDEARSAVGARGARVGHGEDRDEVGDGALADEPLGAVDDVVVAIADGARPGGGGVGAGLGLGQREGDEVLAAGQLREPAGLLLGCPAMEIGSEPSSWTARIRPVVAQARLSCSMARQTLSSSPPRPPCATGNGSARTSCSASSSRRSYGNSPVRSISAARGATRSSASTRTASRSIALLLGQPVRRGSVRRWSRRHPTAGQTARRRAHSARTLVPWPLPQGSGYPLRQGTRRGIRAGRGDDGSIDPPGAHRGRRDRHPGHAVDPATPASQAEEAGPHESPYAVSTEGMKRCPRCGFGNLVTDSTCGSCGAPARLRPRPQTTGRRRSAGTFASRAASTSLISMALTVGAPLGGGRQAVAHHDHAERAGGGHRRRRRSRGPGGSARR